MRKFEIKAVYKACQQPNIQVRHHSAEASALVYESLFVISSFYISFKNFATAAHSGNPNQSSAKALEALIFR